MVRETTFTDVAIEQLLAQVKFDEAGLVPAIIQDAVSKDVLMMAYMNRESLKKTAETGQTWFWSRSRGEYWHKGATSGHTQEVQTIAYDCDGDTLLVKVIPNGPACHNGTYTCFMNVVEPVTSAEKAPKEGDRYADTPFQNGHEAAIGSNRFAILSDLETLLAQRDMERPEGAYTTMLFEKGVDKIAKKVGEEAVEVVIAAKNRDQDELRYEASDLLFHLMVLLRDAKLPLSDIMLELDRRHNKKPIA